MRLYIISCEVFCREFRAFAASSKHLIDMTFQPFGLHDTPDMLREQTQQAIDNVPVGAYDYILIGYGLCSRGTADLVARETPLVMVRGHGSFAIGTDIWNALMYSSSLEEAAQILTLTGR